MAIKSNRDYLEALEKTGDVVKIKDEVDWDLEAGAIIRRTCERRGPAVLLENVKDYPGKRIFGAPLATYRRLAVAMGLDVATPPGKIHEEFEKRFENRIKPVEVKGGPCKENIITGDKVNLFDFPTPMVHDGDGGRYIGTWHAVISMDPDTRWHNWGMYRVAVHNKRHVGCQMLVTSDMGRMLFEKYIPRGKPMPVCVAVGMDPLSSLTGMTAVGAGRLHAFAGKPLSSARRLSESVSERTKRIMPRLAKPAAALNVRVTRIEHTLRGFTHAPAVDTSEQAEVKDGKASE